MDWDPLSNAVQGLSWPVLRAGGVRLDSSVRAGAAKLTSTVTQTVTDVSVYLDDVVGEATYRCEVFLASVLPFAVVAPPTYRPNEDGTYVAMTGTFASIDEAALDTTDMVQTDGSASIMSFEVKVATAAAVVTGSVVLRVVAVVKGSGGSVSAQPALVIGASTYLGAVSTIGQADGFTQIQHEWEVNPATGAAWTQAAIREFDATSKIKMNLEGLYGSGLTGYPQVAQLWVEVPDAVVPLATKDVIVSAGGWVTFNTGFSKTNALGYVVVVRRVGGTGSATWVSLDSDALMPGGHGAYRPTLDRYGIVRSLGDLRTEAHPLILHVAGAASVDSQPYVKRRAVGIHTGVTATQEITAGSTANRGWVRLVARSESVEKPAADLTVKIKLTSSGAQQGGTLLFAPEKVADAPLAWHVLDGTLATVAALTSATQYDIETTCTAADGEGWEQVFLSTETPPVSGDTAGFGGTTDRGDDGTGEANGIDMAAVYGTVPTAPAGFTATGTSNGVTLAWTPTSLGGSFDEYVFEQLAADGVTWQQIGTGPTEATASWTYRGARLNGTAEHYRMRVRHTNGTISVPSTSDDGTATGSVSLLVNVDAGTVFEVAEVHQPASVSFSRARTITERMGRQFVTVTEAPRDRGRSLSSTLDLLPALADQGWFSPWDDLCDFLDAGSDMHIDAYCLLTDYGERKWVWPIVDEGDHVFETLATSPIQFLQVAADPHVVAVP